MTGEKHLTDQDQLAFSHVHATLIEPPLRAERCCPLLAKPDDVLNIGGVPVMI